MEIDIKKVCRVCLNKGNMMSVFKVNISKKIMSCASVQVWPDDGLPNQICNKCTARLHISFQFKKLCEKSDSKLREIIIKSKNPPNETQLDTIQEPPQVAINNSMYIECVPIITPNFISIGEQSHEPHVNFNTETNENIVQYNSVNNVYQMPVVQLESMQTPSQIQPEVQINNMNVNVNVVNETSNNCTKKQSDMQCKVCGKVLSSLSKLNRHMCIHTKDPPYKCNVCMKGFTHCGNYKVHMRMHNDEKPFKCNTCGHSSRQQADIEKHMRTHTGERPHGCHLCTKAFATRSNLIAHIRTHTGERPYVCCVCQKAFCQSNELTKHMRTHTGEKTHVCDVCQRGFNGASSLKAHRRLHTGEKPYSCGVCDKSFAQSQSLKVHMKIHNVGGGNMDGEFNKT
ncbi:zinc finger protein 782-like [Atheta coriaria]|uniref:zinc finger protein 782-like n=1 Tax=Dalotia coriaria TaxID=877792 RepID=UPI0031F3549E